MHVNLEEKPVLQFMSMYAGAYVYLVVISSNQSLDTLVNLAGITPTEKWSKHNASKKFERP